MAATPSAAMPATASTSAPTTSASTTCRKGSRQRCRCRQQEKNWKKELDSRAYRFHGALSTRVEERSPGDWPSLSFGGRSFILKAWNMRPMPLFQ